MNILEIAKTQIESMEDITYDKLDKLIDKLEELQEDIKTDYAMIAKSQYDENIDLVFWMQELRQQKQLEKQTINKIKNICNIN